MSKDGSNRFSGTDQQIEVVEFDVTFDQKMALQQTQMWVSAQNVVADLKHIRIESLCEQTATNLFICLAKQLSNLLNLAQSTTIHVMDVLLQEKLYYFSCRCCQG